MRIRYMLDDWDGNISPSEDADKTPEYYVALGQHAQILRRANDPEDESVPPNGIWTGKDRREILQQIALLPLPNAWSCFDGGGVLANLATGDLTYNPLITILGRRFLNEVREEVIPQLIANNPNLKLYDGDKEFTTTLERIDTSLPIETYFPRVQRALHDYAYRKNLRNEDEELTYTHIFEVDYSSIAIDIRLKNVNKETALDVLTSETGFLLEDILGTGDSPADIPWLKRVGFVGCHSLASPECIDFVVSRGENGHPSKLPYVAGINDVKQHFLGIQLS